MKKSICILLVNIVLVLGCTDIDNVDPYSSKLQNLKIQVIYPDGYTEYQRAGVAVQIEEINQGYSYKTVLNGNGRTEVLLRNGVYRVKISDKVDGNLFKGTADQVKLGDLDMNLSVPLVHSTPGDIIIKEVYCGGVTKYPNEGTYQSDKYIILHNNDSEVHYLDSLCLGTLDPYNSQATNVWIKQDETTGASIFPDSVPIVQCIWQFGGDGRSFPLTPGEDAVVVICGAIDHTVQYPRSVNLNKEGYFVCYSPVYFWNPAYHPAPGDKIASARYLNVVIKMGQANAYTFSVYSPAAVIFKAKGTTIQDFILNASNVVQKPGSNTDRVVKIPIDWIWDGVEIFYGGSSNNKKRIPPGIDAGYVTQSALYTGGSLYRKVDDVASQEAGYEILFDENDSSVDFYEREQQFLHE